MLEIIVMAGEQDEKPSGDRVMLFILLMVVMIIGTAAIGRKGRK